MIGMKPGTGGSAGYMYLKSTVDRHRFSSLSSMLSDNFHFLYIAEFLQTFLICRHISFLRRIFHLSQKNSSSNLGLRTLHQSHLLPSHLLSKPSLLGLP